MNVPRTKFDSKDQAAKFEMNEVRIIGQQRNGDWLNPAAYHATNKTRFYRPAQKAEDGA
jgi:hypothetical protein